MYSRQPTSLVISRHYCLRFVLECELKTREQVRSFTFILPMLRIFRNPSFNLWQINSPRFLSVSFALCAGKILIEFSRIVCVSLFSYQGSYSLSLRQLVYFITFISACQVLFLSFFRGIFWCLCAALKRLVYSITCLFLCQQLFLFFSKLFKLFVQKKQFFVTAQLEYHFPNELSTLFLLFFIILTYQLPLALITCFS